MNINDDRPLTATADADPILDQVRSDPNPELVHQHDERQDPLDEAIIDEHEHLDQGDQGIMVKDRDLNPPPSDEYD